MASFIQKQVIIIILITLVYMDHSDTSCDNPVRDNSVLSPKPSTWPLSDIKESPRRVLPGRSPVNHLQEHKGSRRIH